MNPSLGTADYEAKRLRSIRYQNRAAFAVVSVRTEIQIYYYLHPAVSSNDQMRSSSSWMQSCTSAPLVRRANSTCIISRIGIRRHLVV